MIISRSLPRMVAHIVSVTALHYYSPRYITMMGPAAHFPLVPMH